MTNASTARAFKADTCVCFKDGFRPVASTLPVVMTVFISTARETTVLVDGKPQRLATVALRKA